MIPIDPRVLDTLILGRGDWRRQLQDSPILGDVWSEFALQPSERHDLLLTCHYKANAEDLAKLLDEESSIKKTGRTKKTRGAKATRSAREVSHLHGFVAAKLDLIELTEIALPATTWFGRVCRTMKAKDESRIGPPDRGVEITLPSTAKLMAFLRGEIENERRADSALSQSTDKHEDPDYIISAEIRKLISLGLVIGVLHCAKKYSGREKYPG